MSNYGRLLEMLQNTKTWLVVQEADGRNWIQDVEGSIITGLVPSETAELIVRLRNQMPTLLEELQQLRAQVAMMDRG